MKHLRANSLGTFFFFFFGQWEDLLATPQAPGKRG